MSQSSEHQRIALLRALFPPPASGLGIGDDAAVLLVEHNLVVSTDAAVEGIHFRRAWMTLREIGYRATMAALSDLAAMGAEPLGMVSSLALPPELSDEDLISLAEGQREAALATGTPMVGGNLTRATELSLHTTVLGQSPRPLRRDGAKPGDRLWACGEFGLAGLGLSSFERKSDPAGAELVDARAAFVRPFARIREGALARKIGANAMIDVSDGLVADAAHLAQASEVALVLDSTRIVSDGVRRAAARLGLEPLQATLLGGEDYALLASSSIDLEPAGFSCVGYCEAGPMAVLLLAADGTKTQARAEGFDHFRAR